MDPTTDRRRLKAAQRADRDGSGPTLDERPPLRFPGAAAKFALFGEVLVVGVLVTVLGIAVVTLPAALAAGIRHLRRYARAEGSPLSLFFADVRSALPGGLAVGAASAVIAAILVLDLAVAGTGALPGAPLFTAIGWVGLLAIATALLALAGQWTPRAGWRGAAARLAPAAVADVPGVLYLAATAVFVGVATWALVPLVVPALGCAALAVVAIPERARRRRAA